MLWDGLFLAMAVILAINGYRRGVVASWRGPLAMVAATLIVRQFYVDFAAWVTARLRVSPDAAVVIGYLMLWFSIEALLEIVLASVLPGGQSKRPGAFNRIFGAGYGLAKAVVIAILPLMAASAEIKIPPPPPDKSGLVIPDFVGITGSMFIPGMRTVAGSLLPLAGPLIVSTKEPSYKPDYETPELKGPSSGKALEKDIESVLK